MHNADTPKPHSTAAAPPRLAFFGAETDDARDALTELKARYPEAPPDDADAHVVLGGDGTLLETLHGSIEAPQDAPGAAKPVFGMNRGSVGFLLNAYSPDDLTGRIARAQSVNIHPLRMKARCADGTTHDALAFNEISLFRESRYAAKLAIAVDGIKRMEELICDGLLVSTPAGSTAYNLSAHGPIIPLSANILAMTPISPFRPRRWRGALIPGASRIVITVREPLKRPAGAAADFREVRDIAEIEIYESRSISRTLLFDPDNSLEERILKEQFLT